MISTFNNVDLGFLILIFVFGLIGFGLGITRMFLGIIGWIGATLLTTYAYLNNSFDFIRPFVQQFIPNPYLADSFISFIVFTFSIITLRFLNRLISGYVKSSILSGVDRSLGIVLGVALATGLLSTGFLFMYLTSQPHQWPLSLRSARSFSILSASAKSLSQFLPKSLRETTKLTPDLSKPSIIEQKVILENLVDSLSQPQPSSSLRSTNDPEQSQLYQKDQTLEMDRLFKNYEKAP